MTHRALLVDDHALLREMLGEFLASEGFEVASTGDTKEAIRMGLEQQPDVAVLHVDMPGRSTFEVARELLTGSPGTRVLFLSAYVRDAYIEQAVAVEAAGYLTKSERPQEILAAIRAVADGEVRFSRAVLRRLVVDEAGVRLQAAPATRAAALTEREREVLHHVAHGLSQKQIGRLLGISIKTVQHHLVAIMDKLEIHDRVELTRFAIREGIVEP